MTSDILSVRANILQSINTFPWSSTRQAETIRAYIDHQVAGRGNGRQALLRSGMVDLTDRQLQYQLDRGLYYVQRFNRDLNQNIGKIDCRRIHQLAYDDTLDERTGNKVFGAAYQYNHSQSSVCWAQTLVDRVLVTDRVMNVSYTTYLPKKYLIRADRPFSEFRTKNQLMREIFQKDFNHLRAQGLAPDKIWTSLDSWYASRLTTRLFRQSGINFLQGLKKSSHCSLFGRKSRIDEIFNPDAKWQYVTDPQNGKRIHYQVKILNLTCHGRCQVFAIRRGNDKRIRYYATNHLKVHMQRLLLRLKKHWQVELMHHDLKQYFGLSSCCTGKETLNQVHWSLCYTTYLLFCRYQYQTQQKKYRPTIPQLIHAYQYDYDYERARKCFFSPKARTKLIKRILGGKC